MIREPTTKLVQGQRVLIEAIYVGGQLPPGLASFIVSDPRTGKVTASGQAAYSMIKERRDG